MKIQGSMSAPQESGYTVEFYQSNIPVLETKIDSTLKLRAQYTWAYRVLVTLTLEMATEFKFFEDKATDKDYINQPAAIAAGFLQQVKDYAKCVVKIRNCMQTIAAQIVTQNKAWESLPQSAFHPQTVSDIEKLKQYHDYLQTMLTRVSAQSSLDLPALLSKNVAMIWKHSLYALGAAARAYDNCLEKRARVYQKAIFDQAQNLGILKEAVAKIIHPKNSETQNLREEILTLREKIRNYMDFSGDKPSSWGKQNLHLKKKTESAQEPNTYDFVSYLGAFITEIAREKNVSVVGDESLEVLSWREIFAKLDAYLLREPDSKTSSIFPSIEPEKLTTLRAENSSFAGLDDRLKEKEEKTHDRLYVAGAGAMRFKNVVDRLEDFNTYFSHQCKGGKESERKSRLKEVQFELNMVIVVFKQYAEKTRTVEKKSKEIIQNYKKQLENMRSAASVRKNKNTIETTLKNLAAIFAPVIIQELPKRPLDFDKDPAELEKSIAEWRAQLVSQHELEIQWSKIVLRMLNLEYTRATWPERIQEINTILTALKDMSVSELKIECRPGGSSLIAAPPQALVQKITLLQELYAVSSRLPMSVVFIKCLESNMRIFHPLMTKIDERLTELRALPSIKELKFPHLLVRWREEAKAVIMPVEGAPDLPMTPLDKLRAAITEFDSKFTSGILRSSREWEYEDARKHATQLSKGLYKFDAESTSVVEMMPFLEKWCEEINKLLFKKFINSSDMKYTPKEQSIPEILKIRSFLISAQASEKKVEPLSTVLNKQLLEAYLPIFKLNPKYVKVETSFLKDLINKELKKLSSATRGVGKEVFNLLIHIAHADGIINVEGDLYKKIMRGCQSKSLIEKRFMLIRIISEQSIQLMRKNSPVTTPPDHFLPSLITVAEKLYTLYDQTHEALLDSYRTRMEITEWERQRADIGEILLEGDIDETSPPSVADTFALWHGNIYTQVNLLQSKKLLIFPESPDKKYFDVEVKAPILDRGPKDFKVIKMKLWPSICDNLPFVSFEELAQSILSPLALKPAAETLAELPTVSKASSSEKTSLLDGLDDEMALQLDYTVEPDSKALVDSLKKQKIFKDEASIINLVSSHVSVFIEVWSDPALNELREDLRKRVQAEMKQQSMSSAKRALLNFVLEAPSHTLINPCKEARPIHFFQFQCQPATTSVWQASFIALQTVADEKQLFFGEIPHAMKLQEKIAGGEFKSIFRRMAEQFKINICLYQQLEPVKDQKSDGEEEEMAQLFKRIYIELTQFGHRDATQSIYLYRDQQGRFYPLLPAPALAWKPKQVLQLQKLAASVLMGSSGSTLTGKSPSAQIELSVFSNSSTSSSSLASSSSSLGLSRNVCF